MVAINNGAGPQSAFTNRTELQVAITRRAEFHAEVVGRYLTQVVATTARRFPAAFLLELGAVLQIGLWERQGVREHISADLPSYAEAAAELAARAQEGASAFPGLGSAVLSLRVLHASICNIAWEAPELLGAELVVDVNEEDELIDLLAGFVWNNRAELAQLTNGNR